MLNIVPFGATVLEKKIFLNISLYITIQKFKPLGWGHPLNTFKSPCSNDVPCWISTHSNWWFMGRKFL